MATGMKAVLEALLPHGALWRPRPGGDFDRLLDGMGDNAQEVYDFLDALAHIRDPRRSELLADLEKEFGITTNEQLTEAIRRVALAAAVYAKPSPMSFDNLQDALRASGFEDIYVSPNDPAQDPDGYLGVWVVNGPIYDNQAPAYIMQCGGERAYCGNGLALLGYFINIARTMREYDTPPEPWWPLVFFVHGDSGAWPIEPLIEPYECPHERYDDLVRLILKYKPMHSWGILIADRIRSIGTWAFDADISVEAENNGEQSIGVAIFDSDVSAETENTGESDIGAWDFDADVSVEAANTGLQSTGAWDMDSDVEADSMTTLIGVPILSYSDLVFTRASSNYLLYGGVLTGPFPANVLATRNIVGQVCGQFEGARVNYCEYSHEFENVWWNFGGYGLASANDGNDIAPDGTATASRITLLSVAGFADCEKHSGQITTNSSVFSIFAKQGTQNNLLWVRNGDAATKATGYNVSAVWNRYDHYNADGGWKYLVPSLTNDGLTGGAAIGDNQLWWGAQTELATFPSSPIINNTGGSLTRPPDVGYWPAAVVPAAMLAGTWRVDIYPEWTHAEMTGNAYIAAIDANNFLRFNGTSKTYELYDGGVKVLESNALTTARWTKQTLTIARAAGTIGVVGALTGDGVVAGTAGAWAAGDVFYGGDHASGNQAFADLTEPY